MEERDESVRAADEAYMREALRYAALARGRTSPNPMVGAVIVQGGVMVGHGWHHKAGAPHAEVHALIMAGSRACGATLYVTLEPCAHYGRTAPCADAVVAAGLSRVVVATVDPNPRVCGKGIERLRAAGISVTVGVLEEEARRLNEAFFRWVTTGKPFVWLKMAMSLDGRIATVAGESKWVTGEAARATGHEMRDAVDAILVGIRTVLADDPALTTRLPEGRDCHHPTRIVLDRLARTPRTAQIVTDGVAPTIIAVTAEAPAARIDALRRAGAEVLVLAAASDGEVSLPALLTALGEREITSLLVEGGGTVHYSFLAAGLADKVTAFLAPRFFGGAAPGGVGGAGFAHIKDAPQLMDVTTTRIGDDLCVTGYVAKPAPARVAAETEA